MLDCGCGEGDLVAEALARGFDALGMDVVEPPLLVARERSGERFVRHSIETVPWPIEPESFDIVSSFEVIEHLLEPRALLDGAHEALRPGGYLALTTPFHGLTKNIALALFRFDRHFDVDGDHIRFFSDASLRRLLTEAGFTDMRFTHLGRCHPLWASTFVWARRR